MFGIDIDLGSLPGRLCLQHNVLPIQSLPARMVVMQREMRENTDRCLSFSLQKQVSIVRLPNDPFTCIAFENTLSAIRQLYACHTEIEEDDDSCCGPAETGMEQRHIMHNIQACYRAFLETLRMENIS